MITVWIDADSCPKTVRQYLVSYTEKLSLKLFFVANHEIPQDEKHSNFKMIICNKESQAADDYIVNNVSENDLVVTRDIPLADRLVNKNICVMNDRGTLYTKENIKQRLSERDFNLQLAQIGLCGTKKSYYGKKEFSEFANCFDKQIHALIRNESLKHK